jgi:hypothetical protein
MRRFRDLWINQTELGKRFGVSAVEVGKILAERGLKDSATKQATPKAIAEGYAKATPLGDGTPFFMWNSQKVTGQISKTCEPLTKIDRYAKEAAQQLKEIDEMWARGEDKMASLMQDVMFEDVPQDISEEVKRRAQAYYEHLKKE